MYSMGDMYSISCMAIGRSRMTIDHKAGTKHVGFTATRQTLFAQSTKRREVPGESSEG